MPNYQIIKGDYSYEVEADNYADALKYLEEDDDE
jgi:hypothetical protein